MINYRKLNKNDINHFDYLISYEGEKYNDFLNIGWSRNEIKNQFNKNTNLSYGVFKDKTLVSFILGDLFNIEKILEYEIFPSKKFFR